VIAPGQGTVTSESFGTITNFTTTGNTTLGDATTDTLTVGVTGIVKDSSGNVGIGTASPTALTSNKALTINSPTGFGSLLDLKTNETLNLRVFSNASNSGLSVKTSTPLLFDTNDTERMRIDSSGNVGVGTTSTSAKLSVSLGGVSTLGQQSNQALALLGGGSNNQLCQIGMGYGTGTTYTPTAIGSITTTQTGNTIADLIFATRSVNTDTAPTERMRIGSSGRILAGTTASFGNDGLLQVDSTTIALNGINVKCASANYAYIAFTNTNFMYFTISGGGSNGTITWNGSNTVYATTSDQRLKENIVDAPSALNKINSVKIRSFNWIENKKEVDFGVIAQELVEVAPEAVHVPQKEEENWGVDTAVLVPTMIKAIQEQQALITAQAETINALTARVTALENR
jgi:hypothetical protein